MLGLDNPLDTLAYLKTYYPLGIFLQLNMSRLQYRSLLRFVSLSLLSGTYTANPKQTKIIIETTGLDTEPAIQKLLLRYGYTLRLEILHRHKSFPCIGVQSHLGRGEYYVLYPKEINDGQKQKQT